MFVGTLGGSIQQSKVGLSLSCRVPRGTKWSAPPTRKQKITSHRLAKLFSEWYILFLV